MYEYYNPNPTGRTSAGDCAVRAVAKALDISWENAFWKIALNAFYMGDVMSSNAVWGAVLREHGFRRQGLPHLCPDCYTAEDFSGYSYSSKPSNSEFMRFIKNKRMDEVLLVVDDMMEELQGVAPKLYYETMERVKNI